MQEESVQTLLGQAKRILAAARRRIAEEHAKCACPPERALAHVAYFEDYIEGYEGEIEEMLTEWQDCLNSAVPQSNEVEQLRSLLDTGG